MYAKGQADAWGVGGLVALLVLIAIGALVLYEVTGALDVESGRTAYTDQLLNTDFADNASPGIPDNWDNVTEGSNVSVALDATNHWVTVDRTDNENTTVENGIWWQAVAVSSLHDKVSSATVTYKYRVIDNENAASIVVKVLLDDGTDNTTLLNENVTTSESASWTSGENNVISTIDATGTYTLYLVTEIIAENVDDRVAISVQVGWDDANLTVNTYSKGYAENAIGEVESKGETVFSLLTILGIVVVAALIIGVVIRSIGGGMARERR